MILFLQLSLHVCVSARCKVKETPTFSGILYDRSFLFINESLKIQLFTTSSGCVWDLHLLAELWIPK